MRRNEQRTGDPMNKLLAFATLCAAVGAADAAQAVTYTYVGSWNVADGPFWDEDDAPGITPPLSALQTAALLFGGSASDYAISTAGPSTATINFEAWVDGYGDPSHLIDPYGTPGTPVSQSFVQVGDGEYQDGGTYSAYVFDHACGDAYCDTGSGDISTNYAFRIAASAAPEPASWAMMVGGFAVVGAGLRRRVSARVARA
jgi:hypothetical protein